MGHLRTLRTAVFAAIGVFSFVGLPEASAAPQTQPAEDQATSVNQTMNVYLYVNNGGRNGSAVGHAWLGFDFPTGEVNVGFYPGSSKKKERMNGPGEVRLDDWRVAPDCPRKSAWRWRWCYTLSYKEVIALANCVIDDIQMPPRYQLFPNRMSGPGMQCAGWATGKLQGNGIPLPPISGPITPAALGQQAWDRLVYQGNPNGPGGSMIEQNPPQLQLDPPSAPVYDLDPGRFAGGPYGLCMSVLNDAVDFELRTGFPVHVHTHAPLTVNVGEIVALTYYALNGNLDGSGLDWGDGSGFPFESGNLGVTMEPNDVYMRSFQSAGSYPCRAVLFLNNAIEVHEFVINVSDGPVLVRHRRNIPAGQYPELVGDLTSPAVAATVQMVQDGINGL